MARNSCEAKAGRDAASGTWLHASAVSAGSAATVTATCATINTVHVDPSRARELPPRSRRLECMPRPVTCSAGMTPIRTATSAVRPAMYSSVSGATPSRAQNGAPALSVYMIWLPRRMPNWASARPAADEMAASTSASTNSWPTTRVRLAPSAVRTAISPCRAAVRAYTSTATLTQTMTSARLMKICTCARNSPGPSTSWMSING
jgi:hypothetical protein